MNLPEKIASRLRVTDQGCWEWMGAKNSQGYGTCAYDGVRHWYVHRLTYTLLVDEIPHGYQIDHLCRNRICANPEHLEPVTPQVNFLRGKGRGAEAVRTGKCIRGHDLNGPNGYVRPDGKGRICRTCLANNQRARRKRAREARRAV